MAYASFSLTASITLSWPNFASSGTNVYAVIMDITANAGGYSITMPDATQAGTGTTALFRNTGAQTISILDSAGGAITTVAAGISKFLYLTANSTAAGTWGVVTFGAGTSTADASLLAGFGLKAITTTLNQSHVVNEVSAAVSIASGDRAAVYAWTSGTWAANLPTSASVGNDFFFIAKNGGTGTITLTPSGADTIDNAATVALAPNDACVVFSSGANNRWYTAGLGRNVSFAFTQLVKSVAGNTDVTLTSSECANKIMTFTGALTGNINVIVTNTASVYYIYNNTTGAFTLTVKTAAGTGIAIAQTTRDIAVCDATNVYSGKTNTTNTVLFANGSAGTPSISFASDSDTGWYRDSEDVPAVAAGGLAVMRWNTAASAVNGIDVFNSATGTAPYLIAFGTDSNISLGLRPKGEGGINFVGGTTTTSQPIINATQTWNAGGVTFTGIKLNVTSTASAAGSMLADLQVASVSQWSVTKGGAVTQLGGLTLGGALTYGGVTLSNAVTGTGNMVLSASPTLTGTLTAAAITASGVVQMGNTSKTTANSNAGFVTYSVENTNAAGFAQLQLTVNSVNSGMAYVPGTSLKFFYEGAETARFNAAGYFKASNSGSYLDATGTYHEFVQSANAPGLYLTNSLGAGFTDTVMQMRISYAANTNTSWFWYAGDTSATRGYLKSDGGIGNFSANNVNLSDLRVKPWYEPYVVATNDGSWTRTDRFAGLWEGHKRMRGVWGVFKYGDQTHDDVNHGYTAQGVRKAFRGVADELVDRWDAKGDLLGVYYHDLHNITGAIVTELQFGFEEHDSELKSLRAEVASLRDELQMRKAA